MAGSSINKCFRSAFLEQPEEKNWGIGVALPGSQTKSISETSLYQRQMADTCSYFYVFTSLTLRFYHITGTKEMRVKCSEIFMT